LIEDRTKLARRQHLLDRRTKGKTRGSTFLFLRHSKVLGVTCVTSGCKKRDVQSEVNVTSARKASAFHQENEQIADLALHVKDYKS